MCEVVESQAPMRMEHRVEGEVSRPRHAFGLDGYASGRYAVI